MKCFPVDKQDIKQTLDQLEPWLHYIEVFEVENGKEIYYVCIDKNRITKELLGCIDEKAENVQVEPHRQNIIYHRGTALYERLKREESNNV